MTKREKIQELVRLGAIFYISHSGGKDSQVMFLYLSALVPNNQLVVVHAHLPGVEWEGTINHVKSTIGNVQYIEVTACKTFFEMVDHRQKWPAPKYRQCTSDLKRGPIEKAIRHDLKTKNKKIAVSCMGLRAEESTGRAKMKEFGIHRNLSKAGRTVYNLLPIHKFLEHEIFDAIRSSGQKPHWAYSTGMSRLSCCFCIMASSNDLRVAAMQNPKLYRKYVLMEKKLNFTLRYGKALPDITGIDENGVDISPPALFASPLYPLLNHIEVLDMIRSLVNRRVTLCGID